MAGLADRIQVRGQFAHSSEAETDRNETGCPSNLSPHFMHMCVCELGRGRDACQVRSTSKNG